jgi:hypothetical protein
MKRVRGKEMRRLVIAVTAMTLALVIGVTAYFMVDIILTTNDNIEENKQMTLEKTVLSLEEIGEHVTSLSTDPGFLGMLAEDFITDVMSGNVDRLYDMVATFAVAVNPLEYAAVVVDGEVVDYRNGKGVEVEPTDVRMPSAGSYEVISDLGGCEGCFVSMAYPIDLSTYGFDEFYLNMIIDRTAEMQEIEDYFVAQRSELITRMSIVAGVAILLILLISTFGLRYFTNKYVMEPVNELNHMAESIADGTFEGDVVVDEDSAYAALQGVLRSGQLILRRMEERANGE